MVKKLNIALVGNPNSGKSSLFNSLTGLNQKVGNFPGVTVDKKTGNSTIATGLDANIIDVGGGDSYFVDALLEKGYKNVYVLDTYATQSLRQAQTDLRALSY